MPRRKSLDPKVEVKAYLLPSVAAKLQLAAFSPLRGTLQHGEQSRIINEALELYFNMKGPQDVQPRSDSETGLPPESSDPARPE